jgi:hypothetical protein
VLKDAGLVSQRVAGTSWIYRRNPAGLGALRDQLRMFWDRAPVDYKEIVEQPTYEVS